MRQRWVWLEVCVQLEVNPAQTAKALFIVLQRRCPSRFFDGQLRTLQRRVRNWRREQLYKAEIVRVEPTPSAIGSQSRPVAPLESRETRIRSPSRLPPPGPLFLRQATNKLFGMGSIPNEASF